MLFDFTWKTWKFLSVSDNLQNFFVKLYLSSFPIMGFKNKSFYFCYLAILFLFITEINKLSEVTKENNFFFFVKSEAIRILEASNC